MISVIFCCQQLPSFVSRQTHKQAVVVYNIEKQVFSCFDDVFLDLPHIFQTMSFDLAGKELAGTDAIDVELKDYERVGSDKQVSSVPPPPAASYYFTVCLHAYLMNHQQLINMTLLPFCYVGTAAFKHPESYLFTQTTFLNT